MAGKRKHEPEVRRNRVYDVFERFYDQKGYSPSVRELRDLAEISTSSLVQNYLDQLVEMGRIDREPGVARSLRPANHASRSTPAVLNIPIVSRIAAGEFLPVPSSDFANYDYESTVDILQSDLQAGEKVKDLFALEVKGDSMVDAMVKDGDILIMKPAHEAHNGEMVAILRTDENTTTLKYFFKEKDHVRLQPANPTMDPIIVDDPSTLKIQGKVVKLNPTI